jgi:hypothetical protein
MTNTQWFHSREYKERLAYAVEAAQLKAPPPQLKTWNAKNIVTNIQVGAIFALILVSFVSIEVWTNHSSKPISCPVGTHLYVGDNGYMECDK